MSKENTITTYSTSQIAKRAGLHSNTVRLYEEWGLIQKPERKKNGYRVFTDVHIKQFELARKALQIEVLQAGLRKRIIVAGRLGLETSFVHSFLLKFSVDYGIIISWIIRNLKVKGQAYGKHHNRLQDTVQYYFIIRSRPFSRVFCFVYSGGIYGYD